MQELIEERRAVQAALSQYHMLGWLWEKDAGARPESIRSTYLKEVEACDLYIGLFWLGYGPYTIEEFDHARTHKKPCLIYEKHVDVDQRDPQLEAFLDRIGKVDDGLTICRFETPEQLARQVKKDVMRLLTTRFRESRLQPTSTPPKPSPGPKTVKAKSRGIAVGNNYGKIIQNNYSPSDDEQDE